MKSLTTLFGMLAVIGLTLSAGANVFDPNETLPNWIWPVFKMMQAVGTGGLAYFAADWKRLNGKNPEPPESKPGQ